MLYKVAYFIMQVVPASSYMSLGTYAIAASLQSFISSTLGINASHITITDLVIAPGASLGSNSQSVNLRMDFTVSPPDSFSAAQARQALLPTMKLHTSCRS